MTAKRYGTGLNGRIEEMECGAFTGYAEYSALLKERDALAVENESLKAYRPQPGGMAMMEALDAFEAQDDYPEGGMMDAFEILCCKRLPTTATDAAIANIQAQAIPDGWKLIPEELHIGEEGIELICSQCGNGDEEYGEFVDGVFRVGEVETDDGKKVYGLHVTCADYPEEGSVTIAIFDNPLRKDPAHD